MTISTEPKIWTDEAFMALPDDGNRYSLDGEDVVPGFTLAVSELFVELNFTQL